MDEFTVIKKESFSFLCVVLFLTRVKQRLKKVFHVNGHSGWVFRGFISRLRLKLMTLKFNDAADFVLNYILCYRLI